MSDTFFGPEAEVRDIAVAPYSWHVRVLGPREAPPLVLLHGFPQTGAMWAPFVRALTALEGGLTRRLIIPDLPGYGLSQTEPGAAAAEKRAWARALAGLMDAVEIGAADIAGHDRGGRLAYRFALDHPSRVRRLIVLDILPTIAYWRGLATQDFALKIYHWMFLAQPAPLPETLIGAAPEFYIEDKLSRWSGGGDLSAFDPGALEAYKDNARRPERLAAMCDDYRAGAGMDAANDADDEAHGRKIAAQTLALWGAAGLAQRSAAPLEIWSRWCAQDVAGAGLKCGHFLPEEAPEQTASEVSRFLSAC